MPYNPKVETYSKSEELSIALEREKTKVKGNIKETYVHKQKNKEELSNPTPNKSMKKVKTQNVKQVIAEVMGRDTYAKIDEMRMNEDESQRTVRLHGSSGRHAAKNGHLVLELNIAGSGFTEFRKMEHNSTGKHTFTAEPVHDSKATRIKLSKDPTLDETDLDSIQKFTDNAKIEDLLDEVYGKRYVDPAGKMSEYVRTKLTEEGIQKIYIPGPTSMDSNLNADEKRSMNNARHTALQFAKDFLTQKFEMMKSDPSKRAPIDIMMQGHSRGGVAIGESLQMIEKWVHDKFPEYEHLVNYRLTQFDPVPGTGSYDNHKTLDLNKSGEVKDTLNKAERGNYADPTKVNNTVIYAMSTTEDLNHQMFFDPQKVLGAKRVIISPESHGLMLGQVDDSQAEGLAKIGFTLASNGEVYRGSGINDLPEGVYVCDEDHVLVKCDNVDQIKTIMSKVVGNSIGQKTRLETILEASRDCLERAPILDQGEELNPIKDDNESKLIDNNAFEEKPTSFFGVKVDENTKTQLEGQFAGNFLRFTKSGDDFIMQMKFPEEGKDSFDNEFSIRKNMNYIQKGIANYIAEADGSYSLAKAANLSAAFFPETINRSDRLAEHLAHICGVTEEDSADFKKFAESFINVLPSITKDIGDTFNKKLSAYQNAVNHLNDNDNMKKSRELLVADSYADYENILKSFDIMRNMNVNDEYRIMIPMSDKAAQKLNSRMIYSANLKYAPDEYGVADTFEKSIGLNAKINGQDALISLENVTEPNGKLLYSPSEVTSGVGIYHNKENLNANIAKRVSSNDDILKDFNAINSAKTSKTIDKIKHLDANSELKPLKAPKKPNFFKKILRGVVKSYAEQWKKYKEEKAIYDQANKLRKAKILAGTLKTNNKSIDNAKVVLENTAVKNVDKILNGLYDSIHENQRNKVQAADGSYEKSVDDLFNDPDNRRIGINNIRNSDAFISLIKGKTEKQIAEMAENPDIAYSKYLKATNVTSKDRTSVKNNDDIIIDNGEKIFGNAEQIR